MSYGELLLSLASGRARRVDPLLRADVRTLQPRDVRDELPAVRAPAMRDGDDAGVDFSLFDALLVGFSRAAKLAFRLEAESLALELLDDATTAAAAERVAACRAWLDGELTWGEVERAVGLVDGVWIENHADAVNHFGRLGSARVEGSLEPAFAICAWHAEACPDWLDVWWLRCRARLPFADVRRWRPEVRMWNPSAFNRDMVAPWEPWTASESELPRLRKLAAANFPPDWLAEALGLINTRESVTLIRALAERQAVDVVAVGLALASRELAVPVIVELARREPKWWLLLVVIGEIDTAIEVATTSSIDGIDHVMLRVLGHPFPHTEFVFGIPRQYSLHHAAAASRLLAAHGRGNEQLALGLIDWRKSAPARLRWWADELIAGLMPAWNWRS